MTQLHIVQGGVENGDKDLLERIAGTGKTSPRWVAPKKTEPGDIAVIYIGGFGLFATGKFVSSAKPRADWHNRYGAKIASIRLISPPISRAIIQAELPNFKWANFPRSITTPDQSTARQIQHVITLRRRGKLLDFDDESIEDANVDELRAVAVKYAKHSLKKRRGTKAYRVGSTAVRNYVLWRANGICEGCEFPAPFRSRIGEPYLETHHTTQRADDGPDHPAHVIALCPNCHRRIHNGDDGRSYNTRLKRKLRLMERTRADG